MNIKIPYPYPINNSVYGGYVDDRVSFNYEIYNRELKVLQSGRLKSSPCYSDVTFHANFPDLCRIRCQPIDKYILSEDYTYKIFNLFNKLGIVPDGIVPYFESKNKAYLDLQPLNSFNKLNIFSTLCLYRWCDTVPNMIYEILFLQETLKNVSVWQIIHHSMAKHITNYNHNFIEICKGMCEKYIASVLKTAYLFANQDKFINILKSYKHVPQNLIDLPATISKKDLSKNSDLLSEEWKKYYDLCGCNF